MWQQAVSGSEWPDDVGEPGRKVDFMVFPPFIEHQVVKLFGGGFKRECVEIYHIVFCAEGDSDQYLFVFLIVTPHYDSRLHVDFFTVLMYRVLIHGHSKAAPVTLVPCFVSFYSILNSGSAWN